MSKKATIDVKLPKETLAYYEAVAALAGVSVGKVIQIVLAMKVFDAINTESEDCQTARMAE